MTLAALSKSPFPWFADGTISVRSDGSVWRYRAAGKPCEPRRIDLPDRNKGYRNVVLPDQHGRWQTHKAHRLVWEWFNGLIPDGLQIDHINGDKGDNRVSNLRAVTPSENIRASYAAGRPRPWSNTAKASDKATEMGARRRAGATLRQIADEFGISVSHAHRLVGKEGRQ